MLLIFATAAIYSCNTEAEKPSEPENILLRDFTTPFNVPPFDSISNEDFMPAFEEAMRMHNEEIEAIANNEEPATFENTIEQLAYSGSKLSTVSGIFYNLNSANTSDEMQKIAQELSPKTSEHYDNITLNDKLFQRVKTVYDTRAEKNYPKEQAKLLEKTYKGFVRSGANLNEEQKEKLRELNKEISALTLEFGQNVLAETNAFELVVDNEEDLSGLPDGLISAAAETAKEKGKEGKWVFTLQNPSVMPFLQYADKRELRKEMYEAYANRGNNGGKHDNSKHTVKLANLRLEKANLLGYPTHSHYVLEESMAKNPQNVYDLLNKVWERAKTVTASDAAELQKMIDKEGGDFKLAPWDWRYYAEKVKAEKYAFNEEDLKPYFELSNVTKGMFFTLENLFGMKFKELTNLPVYHEDVTTYEVFDENDKHLGILYMDFHPRESKRGGAWMTSFREQSMKNGERVAPVVSIVCNFTKPTRVSLHC